MLQCLKQNKNSELMDPKCKQMITKRQITQSTGECIATMSYTANIKPELLIKSEIYIFKYYNMHHLKR